NRGQENGVRGRPLRYAVRSMRGAGRRLRSAAGSPLSSLLLLVLTLGLPLGAYAGDRTNLPLKNWGGFSLYQDAVYDDLERLVTAGAGGPPPLDTKPTRRAETARRLPPGPRPLPPRRSGPPTRPAP